MLESLKIQFKCTTSNKSYSFPQFWKSLTPPLENLYSLKIRVDPRDSPDFRGLEFPKHLQTIELAIKEDPIRVSFDYIPSFLKSFYCNISEKRSYSDMFMQDRKYKVKSGSDPFHDRQKLNQVFYTSAPYPFKWKLEGEKDFRSML
ncbi:unnamed protein product [Ambrosiozyma monospora]|uniref:Unnamed protein product n=1 Tax=Ambrosiozyma monospora TaxID=43982 RepID=A0ACB5T4J0_AMBMO|nr:unnamed protein product [Ambrosiozyma monospora]